MASKLNTNILTRMMLSDTPPSAKLGAGLSGFAAPFLGNYNWQPPSSKAGSLDVKDLLLLQMMGGGAISDTGIPPDVAPPDNISQIPTTTPVITKQDFLNPSFSTQYPPAQELNGIGTIKIGEPTQSDYFFGGNPMLNPNFKLKPGAEANLQLAKEYASKQQTAQFNAMEDLAKDLNKNKQEALRTTARDTETLNMFAGAFRDNVDYYSEAKKAGLAGNVYKKWLGDAIITGKIDEEWAKKIGIPASGIRAAASFLASRNEVITKMQPVLSQQFSKEGSTRIMESLLKMAEREIAGLESGEEVFRGKTEATMKTLYRFSRAGDRYAKQLRESLGLTKEDAENLTQEQADRVAGKLWDMRSIRLSEEEEKAFNGVKKYVFSNLEKNNTVGNKKTNKPMKFNAPEELVQQYMKKYPNRTREEIIRAMSRGK